MVIRDVLRFVEQNAYFQISKHGARLRMPLSIDRFVPVLSTIPGPLLRKSIDSLTVLLLLDKHGPKKGG